MDWILRSLSGVSFGRFFFLWFFCIVSGWFWSHESAVKLVIEVVYTARMEDMDELELNGLVRLFGVRRATCCMFDHVGYHADS